MTFGRSSRARQCPERRQGAGCIAWVCRLAEHDAEVEHDLEPDIFDTVSPPRARRLP